MTDQVGIGFDSSDIITGVNQGLSSLDSLVRKFVQIDATMVSSNNAVKGRLSELQRALNSSTQGVLGVMAETQRNAYENMLSKARDNDTQQLNLIKRQSMGMQQLYENRLLSEQALNNKELEIWKAHGVALGGIQQAQLKGFSLNSLMAATQQAEALDRLSGGLISSMQKLKAGFQRSDPSPEFTRIGKSMQELRSAAEGWGISTKVADISRRDTGAIKLYATELSKSMQDVVKAYTFGTPVTNPLLVVGEAIAKQAKLNISELEAHAAAVKSARFEVDKAYLGKANFQLQRGANTYQDGYTGSKAELGLLAAQYKEQEALDAAHVVVGEQNFARIMALDDAKAAERSKYISILQAAAAKEEKVRLDLLEATKLIAADEAALEAKRVARFAVNTSMAQSGNSRIAATRESELLRAATTAETEAMRLMSLEGANLNAVVRGLAQGFGFISSGLVTMLPLMAGFALASTAVSTWKAGAEFERSMFVISELAGASATEIVGLSKAILDLGANSQYGPLEAAKGLETLSLAGLKAKDAIAALRPTLNFASAGDVTMEAAAATLVSVATAYRYSATSFELVGDVIAKTAADTMSSVTNMSEAFKTSSVLAQQYKVSLTDTAAALGMLAQIGITGSAAGTAYRNMLTEFNKGSGRAAEGIKMLGVEIHNADGSAKDLMTVMSSLSGGLLKLNAASQLKVLQDITNERGAKATAAFQAEFLSLINKTNPLLQEQADYYFKIGDKVKANNLLQEASLATYEKIRQKMADSADASAGFSSFANLEKEFTALELRKGLAASIETDFVKAFAAVEKQALTLILTLREVVNSQGFQEGLTTFVSTVVSAATTIADVVIGIGKALAFVSDNVATSLAVAVAAIAAYTLAGAAGMAAVAAATAIATAVMGTASVVAGAATTTAGGLAVALGAQTASTGAASAGMALLITGEAAATVATETLTVATMSLSTALAFTPAGILLIGAALVATAVVAVDLKIKNDELADSEEAAARRGVKAAGELAEAHIDASRKIVEAQSKRLQETISTNEAEIALYKENEIKEGLIQNLQRAAFEAGKVKDFETEKTYNTRALELRAELFSKDQIAEKAQGLASINRIEQLGKEEEAVVALAGEVGLLHRLYLSLNPFSGGQESIDAIRQETAANIAAVKAKTAAQVAAAKAQLDTASRTFKELKDLRQKASDDEKRGLHGEVDIPIKGKKDFTRLEKFKETASVELAERVKQAAIEQDLLKTQLANEQSLLKTSYDAKLINAGEFAARDLDLTLQAESRSVRAVVAARDTEEAMYVKQLAAKLAQREKFLAGNKPSTKGYAEGLTSLNTELANLGLQYETINKKSIADQMKLEEAATLRFSIAMAKLAGEVRATEKASDDFWKKETFNRAQSKASADLEETLRYATPEFAAQIRAAAAETARFADLQYTSNQTLLVAESEYAAQLALTNYVELESVALLEAKRKAVDALRAAQERLKTGGTESAEAAGVAARVKLERDNLGKLVTDIATAIETGLYEGGEKGAEALRNLIIAELKKPITIFIKAVVNDLVGGDFSAAGLVSATDGLVTKLGNFAGLFNGSGLGALATSTIGQGLGLSTVVAGPVTEAGKAATALTPAGQAFSALPIGGMLTAYSQGGVGGFASGVASTALAGGVAGAMGSAGFLGGASGALAGLGPYGGAVLAAAAILGIGGGHVSSSNTGDIAKTYNNTGSLLNSRSSALYTAQADDYVSNLQKAYASTAKSLGITLAQTTFSYASNNGRDAQNANFQVSSAAGASSYLTKATNPGLYGNSSVAMTESNLQLEASRAVLSALQGSTLPKYLAGFFDNLVAETATSEQITAVLERAKALASFNAQLQLLPFEPLKDLSYKATTNLEAFSGGLEGLSTNLGTYYDKFYKDNEKTAILTASTSKAFGALGQVMPALDDSARENYRTLVERLSAEDLSIEANAKAYTGVLSLASAMDELAPAFAAAADSASVLKTRTSWFDQLSVISGFSTATEIKRKNELASVTDEVTLATMKLVYAQEDLKTAAEATALAAEATALAASTRLTKLSDSATTSMATLTRAVDAQKAAEKRAYDASKAAATAAFEAQSKTLQSSLDSAKLSLDTVGSSIAKLTTLSSSLKSVLDSMQIIGSEASYRVDAQAQLKQALVTARTGGGLPLDGQLTTAFQTLSKPSEGLFATFEDYARDFYTTANDISSLSDLTNQALTADQISQNLLKTQVELLTEQQKTLKDGFADQVSTLDETLKNAQMQLDAVNGVNTSVLSVADALTELKASLLALSTERALQDLPTSRGVTYTNEQIIAAVKATVATGASAADIYKAAATNYGVNSSTVVAATTGQGLVGFDSGPALKDAYTQAQMAGWLKAAQAGGYSISDMYSHALSEYGVGGDVLSKAGQLAGIPGFDVGINRVPHDMLAFIHKDESVVPASYNPFNPNAATFNSGADMAELLRLFEKLLLKLEAVAGSSANMELDLKRVKEMFDTVTENGRAMQTEVYT